MRTIMNKKTIISTLSFIAAAAATTAIIAPGIADAGRSEGPRTDPNRDVVAPADRTSPEEVIRNGVTGAEYLHAVRSTGYCVQEELTKRRDVESVRVELPSELSADGFAAEYHVMIKHVPNGNVLGPDAGIGVAEEVCRRRHLGEIEPRYQAQQIRDHGEQAVNELLACLGEEPARNHSAAKQRIREAVEAGADTGCLENARLAATVLNRAE